MCQQGASVTKLNTAKPPHTQKQHHTQRTIAGPPPHLKKAGTFSILFLICTSSCSFSSATSWSMDVSISRWPMSTSPAQGDVCKGLELASD